MNSINSTDADLEKNSPLQLPTSRSQRILESQQRNLNSQFWVARLLHPCNGLKVFSGILLFIYAIVPACIYNFFIAESAFLKLSLLSCLAVAAMWLGTSMRLFDIRFKTGAIRLKLNSNLFHATAWTVFIAFVVVTFATAPSIPLISAMQGATADELSQERGNFLKNRVGVEVILLYLSTIFSTTVIPYSMVLLYAEKSKFRHFWAMVFFIFCISFLAKSLFLNLIFPLLVYFALTNKLNKRFITVGIFGSILFLYFTTAVSLGNEENIALNTAISNAEYMSAAYAPTSSLDYFVWRAFAVPIYTATDTLFVHAQQFNDQALLGATSNFLSAVFGLNRINLERYVFEHQFGSWNEIANANAVFIVDAYVNFGYAGVIIFSLVVGQIFRWFRLSTDVGFRSLWLLFAFALFNASLIGMLLSNGFLYMLFQALFVTCIVSNRRQLDVSSRSDKKHQFD